MRIPDRIDASTYEPRHWGDDWEVRFELPEDLKVIWPNDKKKEPYEPMRDTGWEMKFIDNTPTDEEIQQQIVHQWMRNWIDYAHNVQKEIDVEETSIEEIMAADDFSAYVDDKKTGQTGKMYSSGIKRNGKFDVGFKFPDGRQQILRDCSPKLSTINDIDYVDSSTNQDISMSFDYDALWTNNIDS